jgi:mannose/fructose-specific phosphotransferase system component IIA
VLLVAHPGLGEGLLEAAAGILGAPPPVDLLSNAGLSGEELGRRVEAWLRAHPGPALVLADFAPGSCGQAARRAARGHAQAAVVTGVNLPLLLAALRPAPGRTLPELLDHLAARGREAVQVFPPEGA